MIFLMEEKECLYCKLPILSFDNGTDYCSRLCLLTHYSSIKKAPLKERFYQSFIVTKRGCWEWSRGRSKDGYGIGTNKIGAHRLSWILHFDSIPEGLYVCHECDNPPCVNPSHLWLGTHKQNMEDKTSKGRG